MDFLELEYLVSINTSVYNCIMFYGFTATFMVVICFPPPLCEKQAWDFY